MTDGVVPIVLEERKSRIARAQKLVVEAALDAVVLAWLQPRLLHAPAWMGWAIACLLAG